MMDYEPESGWDAINEKSPAVYRYAQWAQARIKELEASLAECMKAEREEFTTLYARIKELEANERFDLDAFYDEMQAKEDRIKELEAEREGLLSVEFENRLRIKELEAQDQRWADEVSGLFDRTKELEAEVVAAERYHDRRIKELEAEDRTKYLGLIDENDRLKRVVETVRGCTCGCPRVAEALADYDKDSEEAMARRIAKRVIADYDKEA